MPARPRWRGGVLQPRITVSQLPCPVSVLDLLPLPDQARLCHTSRSSRAWLSPHVRQWGADCWDEVLKRVFGQVLTVGRPIEKALREDAKASYGDLLRVCAGASDAVDRLSQRHPLPVQTALMSLVLTRHSCKCNLNGDQLQALYQEEHCGPEGCMHLPPAVEQLEAWQEMRLEP